MLIATIGATHRAIMGLHGAFMLSIDLDPDLPGSYYIVGLAKDANGDYVIDANGDYAAEALTLPQEIAPNATVHGIGITSLTITPSGIVDIGDESLLIAETSIDLSTPGATVADPWTITVDESSVVVTHSGSPTAADWQALIRGIVFDDSAVDISDGIRSFAMKVSSAAGDSNTATSTLQI